MRRRPTLGLLATAIVLVTAVSACGNKTSAPPVSANPTADSADQVLYDIQYVLHDNGVQKGRLYADTAYVFDENSRFEFRNVRVDFNNAQGTKTGTLTATRGKYDTRQGMMEGYGKPVRVVTTDGRTLTSNQLRYMQSLNQISSDSAFTYTDGERVQKGVGFRTDPQLTRFQVLSKSQTTGTVTLPATTK